MVSLNIVSIVLAITLPIVLLAWFCVHYSYSYWKRRGVPFLKPKFPFGNMSGVLRMERHISAVLTDIYNKTKDKDLVGIYSVFRPTIVINDPQLIQTILIKDFQYFQDRGMITNVKDPIGRNFLFALKGGRWKELRNRFTPAFSSGKIKDMFPVFLESADRLHSFISNLAESKKTVQIRDLSARYATDVIASVAFGLETDCVNVENHPFRVAGRKIFELSFRNASISMIAMFAPILMKILPLHIVDKVTEKFLYDVVSTNEKNRLDNNIVRSDLFQIFMELRKGGTTTDGVSANFHSALSSNCAPLSLDEMVAQAFVFYIGGFETTSTTMSFCMYELSRNVKLQQRVRNEINEAMGRFGNQINQDSLIEMKLLECCVDETLRLYPPFPSLMREVTKDYIVPGKNITLEAGTPIIIPACAIHRDPRYFDDPDSFNPDHFATEKTFLERPSMGFGQGPRNCIGMRMGKLQVMVGLAAMLQDHQYTINQSTSTVVKLSPKSFVPTPSVPIYLNAIKVL